MPTAVAVDVSMKPTLDVIRIRRQTQRVVVLDVAHRPVVEQAVAAADDVLALAIDVPRGVDARERERAAVRQDAVRAAAVVDVADAVQLLCTCLGRGTSPPTGL